MKDNPLRPYKAYIALVVAFGASLLSSGVLPPLWAAIVTALCAGLGTFLVPNPKIARKQAGPPGTPANRGTHPLGDTL